MNAGIKYIVPRLSHSDPRLKKNEKIFEKNISEIFLKKMLVMAPLAGLFVVVRDALVVLGVTDKGKIGRWNGITGHIRIQYGYARETSLTHTYCTRFLMCPGVESKILPTVIHFGS